MLTLLLDAVPVEVEGTDLVAAALSAGQRLVWVHAPGAGAGAAMATAACRRLGVAHLVADLARLDPAASVEQATLDILMEGGLAGSVVVLVGAERVARRRLHSARPSRSSRSAPSPGTPGGRPTCR